MQKHPVRPGGAAQRDVFAQPGPLPSCVVEIMWLQPSVECLPQWGPFGIEDGVPGNVPVPALIDVALPEYALIGETQPPGRFMRRSVQRIALPFVSAVPEQKRIAHH